MATVAKSIEVDAPVTAVYNQWTQFESFPQFMEGVEAVEQRDDRHLHWRAKVAGKEKEWDAEITEQVPDRRVAWRSVGGAPNAGVVTFDAVSPETTRVSLQLEAEPENVVEKVGDAVGVLDRRVEQDLERFKSFLERRGAETGEWRGSI